MKDIAIIDGDLSLKQEYVTDSEEVAQSLAIELKSQLEELFLDEDFGFDRTVLQDKPDDDEIIAETSRVIANEERVELVGDVIVNQNRKTRIVYIKFAVQIKETGEEIEMDVSLGGIDETGV